MTEHDIDTRPCDRSNDDNEPMGMADALISRGSYLRKLRLLEQADLEEREKQHEQDAHDASLDGDQIDSLANGQCVLRYDSFLNHQRYYDDLKHVDCNYIDYGVVRCAGNKNDGGRLVIEQDKGLGKGGLCWDAAFTLAEHLIATVDEWRTGQCTKVVELGSGTGVCGLMVAKAVARCHVDVTDLPELMNLMNRNVALNVEPTTRIEMNVANSATCESHPVLADNELRQALYGGFDSTATQAAGTVSASVLSWGEVESYRHGAYSVVLGADVVASLYDPVALAHTIHAVCHERSRVYVSYKGRLTGPHERFEQEFRSLFDSVTRLKPKSRNKNPDVWILMATGKRVKSSNA